MKNFFTYTSPLLHRLKRLLEALTVIVTIVAAFTTLTLTLTDDFYPEITQNTEQEVYAEFNCITPITNLNEYNTPNMSKPGYLESYIDPIFGTKITRIVGDPGDSIPIVGGEWGERERHHYSKDMAWNANGSLLYISKRTSGDQGLYLDGETYEPLFLRNTPASEERWHPVNPELKIYMKNNYVGIWNVYTDEETIVKTFSGYSDFQMGPWEGNPSADGNIVPIYAKDPSGNWVGFTYNIETDTKTVDIPMPADIGHVLLSPSANHLMVTDYPHTRIYTLDGELIQNWNEDAETPSHYDVLYGADGEEYAVGTDKGSEWPHGRVLKRNIVTGEMSQITTGGWISHTSSRNLDRPHYVYSTVPGNDRTPYFKEIIAINIDTQEVERLGHMHNILNGYQTEPHASPNMDGTKVIFASNWDDADGPIQAYVIETCFSNAEGTNSPIITRTDSNSTTITQGGTYTAPTGTWTDVEDGSGTASVGGDSVDVNTLGDYNVTLYHTDTDTNTGSITVVYTIEAVPDTTSPVITQVTPVPDGTDTTPQYTFNTDEEGTITYNGDCSSATSSAALGNKTVIFNTLSVGTHSNCSLFITDAEGNDSNTLNIPTFTISESSSSSGGGGGGGSSSSSDESLEIDDAEATAHTIVLILSNDIDVSETEVDLDNFDLELDNRDVDITSYTISGNTLTLKFSTTITDDSDIDLAYDARSDTPIIGEDGGKLKDDDRISVTFVGTVTEDLVSDPTFEGELCPTSQQLTQNLRTGAYNGRYHAYTGGTVTQAHILQAHLNRLGFSSGVADGKLGPISDGAIKRMQTYLGLEKIDGIVGPNTRAKINYSC